MADTFIWRYWPYIEYSPKYETAKKNSLEFGNTIRNILDMLVSVSIKVSKGAKIRNRYNQVPHLTQDINGKVIKNTV